MFINSEFIIDNIKSSDLGINGVSIIRLGGESEISTPWIGGKSIIEEKVAKKDVPYFYGTSKEPLEFSLKFSTLSDAYNEKVLFELGKIFGSCKYLPFISTDFVGKMFFVLATSPINIITYGQFSGWFEVTLRCATPYALSLPEVSTFDISTITSPTIIEVYNKSNVPDYKGDYIYYPEIYIDLKNNNTGITISNLSNGNKQTILTGCTANDSIYMNGQLKQISATNTTSIFQKFNRMWLNLNFGLNKLQISNACIIQIKCQFPLYI